MSYSQKNPHDLGFLSTYVRNAKGGLVAGAADTAEVGIKGLNYYDFDYAAGLKSVTITLTIEAAQLRVPDGEAFLGFVDLVDGLSGPTEGVENYSGGLSLGSGNYGEGTTVSETFEVSPANPGRAVFNVGGFGLVEHNTPDTEDIDLRYSVFVDVQYETPPNPATVTGSSFSLGEKQSVGLSPYLTLKNPDADSVTKYRFFNFGGASGGRIKVGSVTEAVGQWITVSASKLSSVFYVAGKKAGNQTLEVEVYDAATNSWSKPGVLIATTLATTSAVADQSPFERAFGLLGAGGGLADTVTDVSAPFVVSDPLAGPLILSKS